MVMMERRGFLLASALGSALPVAAAPRKMTLCLHQTTSLGAGYRKSLEGWSKAGIKNVEISGAMLDDFLKSDTLDSARKIPADLGLKIVSAVSPAPDLFVQRPGRAAALETVKRRCEQFRGLGAEK